MSKGSSLCTQKSGSAAFNISATPFCDLQSDVSQAIGFHAYPPRSHSKHEPTYAVAVRTLPVFEGGLIWTASDRWNMARVVDTGRQTQKSRQRLPSLTFTSLRCVKHRDPRRPPARPRPRPFSARRCHSVCVSVSRGRGVMQPITAYQSHNRFNLPRVTFTDTLSLHIWIFSVSIFCS